MAARFIRLDNHIHAATDRKLFVGHGGELAEQEDWSAAVNDDRDRLIKINRTRYSPLYSAGDISDLLAIEMVNGFRKEEITDPQCGQVRMTNRDLKRSMLCGGPQIGYILGFRNKRPLMRPPPSAQLMSN